MVPQTLFSLIPVSAGAIEIVEINKHSGHHRIIEGITSLSFKTDHKSSSPEHLLSLGNKGGNDVILRLGYDQMLQCYFSISPCGEVIFQDCSPGHLASIDCMKSSGRGKRALYSLQGEPRQRVIPLDGSMNVHILFGKNIEFRFRWGPALMRKESVEAFRSLLSKIAAKMPAAPFVPKMLTRESNLAVWDDDGQPPRNVHIYGNLGSDALGHVYKAVDLATGTLWAVKTVNNPTETDPTELWRVRLRSQVQKIEKIRHPYINCLEYHQGWTIGANVLLFFPPYDVTMAPDIPSIYHDCNRRPTKAPAWLHNFIYQTLTGLAHLHKHGMVHGNINPTTILNTTKSCLLDISHLCQTKNIRETTTVDKDSDICYSSPESTRVGQFTAKSDVYSFGVVLLGIMGWWCPSEGFSDQRSWRKKLENCRVLGFSEYEDEETYNTLHPLMERTHARINSLVECGIVGPELISLLEENPSLRPSALEARAKLLRLFPAV